MKRKYYTTEISIILFDNTDLLTASGEDDAIVKDSSWKSATNSLNWMS